MKRSILFGLALAMSGGCDILEDALPSVNITGKIQVDGDMPSDFEFELYSVTKNPDAFDVEYCVGDGLSGDCFGRVKTNRLDTAADIGKVVVDGTSFSLEDVTADLAYVLVVIDHRALPRRLAGTADLTAHTHPLGASEH